MEEQDFMEENCHSDCFKNFRRFLKYKPLPPARKLCSSHEKFCKLKKLNVIRRVIHFDDYLTSLQTRSLKAYSMTGDSNNELRSNDHTAFAHKDLKVLFFAPERDAKESNFYGNVSFDIKFEQVLERFGNIYYIEHVLYKKSLCFHVLITRKSSEDMKSMFPNLSHHICDLRNVDSSSLTFMPVTLEEEKSYLYAAQIPFYEYPCNLDLIVDCTEEDTKWFFENSRVAAVNHENANEQPSYNKDLAYAPRVCRNYNSCPPLWNKIDCPFPYSMKKTESKMKNLQMQKWKTTIEKTMTLENWKSIITEMANDCYGPSKYKPRLQNVEEKPALNAQK